LHMFNVALDHRRRFMPAIHANALGGHPFLSSACSDVKPRAQDCFEFELVSTWHDQSCIISQSVWENIPKTSFNNCDRTLELSRLYFFVHDWIRTAPSTRLQSESDRSSSHPQGTE
jgi:hypothetical protein